MSTSAVGQTVRRIIIESDDAGWLIATVEGMPGCVAQGQTERDVLMRLGDAMIAWYQAAKPTDRREGHP